MPTNEERKRIAAELRKIDFEWVSESSARLLFKIEHVLGLYKEGSTDCEGVTNRLADLIEPEPERTCRKIRKNDPTHKGNWNFHCSRCNCYLRGTDEYCSNCGAKVVE